MIIIYLMKHRWDTCNKNIKLMIHWHKDMINKKIDHSLKSAYKILNSGGIKIAINRWSFMRYKKFNSPNVRFYEFQSKLIEKKKET